MPYTLTYKVTSNYLAVTIKGFRLPGKEVEEAASRWSKVAKISEKVGHDHILATIDLSGRLSLESAFKLVEYAQSIGWHKHYKLAIVAATEELFLNLSFLETTMVNRGYELKLFRTKRKAKKWLFPQYSTSIHPFITLLKESNIFF